MSPDEPRQPDITAALRLAAGPDLDDRPEPDAAADLTRARTAVRRRFQRRLRAGTVAAAVLVVTAVGLGQSLRDDGSSPPSASPGGTSAAAGIRLVAADLEADPYRFGVVPAGWSVQSLTPYSVTIAPDDGSAPGNGDVFIGKLVILYDQNPLGSGRTAVDGGQDVYVSSDSGYTQIARRTRPGEPVGVVRVQYPNDTGWTRATMLRFLDGVHVGPGARPGLG